MSNIVQGTVWISGDGEYFNRDRKEVEAYTLATLMFGSEYFCNCNMSQDDAISIAKELLLSSRKLYEFFKDVVEHEQK